MTVVISSWLYSEFISQTEGVGTTRLNHFNTEALHDDGELSSDTDCSDEEDNFVDASDTTPPLLSTLPIELELTPEAEGVTRSKRPFTATELSISVDSPDTPTGAVPTPVPNAGLDEPTPKLCAGFAAPAIPGRFNPRNFVRKLSGLTGTSPSPNSPVVDNLSSLVTVPPMTRTTSKERRMFAKKSPGSNSSSSGTESIIPSATTPTTPLSALSVLGAGKRKESHYEYKKEQDIMGIVMLEIQGADNLPKWANSESNSLALEDFYEF